MSEHVPEWVHMADVPPTDEEPRVRRLGHCPHGAPLGRCWCPGPECSIPDDDEDSGLWAGVAFVLTVALAALVVGVVIGRMTS